MMTMKTNPYRACQDCIYNKSISPCPCDSCEQNLPTNFTEVEAQDERHK